MSLKGVLDNHKVRKANFRTSCVINDPTYINGMINNKLYPNYFLE